MEMSPDKTESHENVLHMVDQHWTHFQFQIPKNPKKNIVFVVGSPGAGKSTVSQIIAGDFEKLHSKLCEEKTFLCPHPHPKAHFLIEEEQGIIRKSNLNRILPGFLTLDDTTSLVDCPSFDENEDIIQQVLGSVLPKKSAERVDSIKFLWVISSFLDSTDNTIDFIDIPKWIFTNIEHIRDSITLIITKVSDIDPVTGKHLSDDEIFDTMETFLEYSSECIEQNSFVECLLKSRSKWVVIRSPILEGPLSKMEHFTGAREQLIELCQKLRGTMVNSNDVAWMLLLDYLESVMQSGKR